MEILAPITENEITESFWSKVRYGLKYFKIIMLMFSSFGPQFSNFRMKTLNGSQRY